MSAASRSPRQRRAGRRRRSRRRERLRRHLKRYGVFLAVLAACCAVLVLVFEFFEGLAEALLRF